MLIHDHFSVAHLIGHPAFGHLAESIKIYRYAKQNDFFDTNLHNCTECFIVGGKLDMLRTKELRSCVQAVILFQAMMEKIPYFVPNIGTNIKPPSSKQFAKSWRQLLFQIKDATTRNAAEVAFDIYKTSFYDSCRNPVIHGKTAVDIEKVNAIRTPIIHEGMRQGWKAYDYLLAEAFFPQQVHESSWGQMCEIHNILDTLAISDYPDLLDMEAQFNKKHLDGFQAANESVP
jgi:hypothetical protein